MKRGEVMVGFIVGAIVGAIAGGAIGGNAAWAIGAAVLGGLMGIGTAAQQNNEAQHNKKLKICLGILKTARKIN